MKILSSMCYFTRNAGNTSFVGEVTWQFIQLPCWQEECSDGISKSEQILIYEY